MSYVIRKMLIKTRKYHYTLHIRMEKIQNTDTAKCWQGCKVTGTLVPCCRNANTDNLAVSYKTEFLPCDPAIALLGTQRSYTEICTRMFIEALSIIAQTWKLTRCPSIGEWINYGISRHWTGGVSSRHLSL